MLALAGERDDAELIVVGKELHCWKADKMDILFHFSSCDRQAVVKWFEKAQEGEYAEMWCKILGKVERTWWAMMFAFIRYQYIYNVSSFSVLFIVNFSDQQGEVYFVLLLNGSLTVSSER